MTEIRKVIPTNPLMWILCKTCNLVTRHEITNKDDCNEKAIYICSYKCGGTKFTLCKEYYILYNPSCIIDENDHRLVYI